MKDDLGDRIKSQYENRMRLYLPRRTYTLVRVDGKAFHQFTRGLERPFDKGLMADMDATGKYLCENVTGCALAFVQSDEISLLLTDFATPTTQAWFDGNLQKIVSLCASLATTAFNHARWERHVRACFAASAQQDLEDTCLPPDVPDADRLLCVRLACFDARAFTISDPTEVENYFIWRQQDATRNSISMAAQAVCSHHELQGKGADVLQEMLWQQGVNWNDYPDGCKRGRCVVRQTRRETIMYTHRQTGELETVEADRNFWQVEAPPVFTRDRTYLTSRLPVYA